MDRRIDEDYKKVVRIKITLIFLIPFLAMLLPVLIAIGVLSSFDSLPFDLWWVFYLILGIMIALPFMSLAIGSIWASKWIANFSFELEREGVRINSGVITKTQKFIPYKRIQDLSVVSGFWERRYGLSTIQIETAGAAISHRGIAMPEGVIPGLKDPDPIAKEIRSRMASSDTF